MEYTTLLQVWQQTGEKPRALRDRPQLKDSNRLYLDAFFDLSAGRSVGDAPQPITEAAIVLYAREIVGVTSRHQLDRFFHMIRYADSAYLTRHFEKAKRA